MEVLIAFIAFFATVFGIMYMHYNTRNKERLALIDKGASATLFDTKSVSTFSWGKLSLKLGMLSIGIALGILIGELMVKSFGLDDDVSYPSMIFLFGGIALVAFYLVDRKLK